MFQFQQQQHNKRDQQREELLRNTWVDCDYMLHWLEEEKVLEFILDRKTTHFELVKRIDVIFQLLDHQQALDIEKHLDPLWQLTLHGQHEVCDMIYDIMFGCIVIVAVCVMCVQFVLLFFPINFRVLNT